eukprot:CAMPEP_0119140016 /NCGR_PEP_ID=MMETSP1310-20130426/28525_1 /TAXON_ID=464262 /ORGANISM="Genus nov. species nov., Strain RCC2339" /LENGTH=386 /DNA_ID=CAMNT_0007131347 /DNA_START=245 /DNA_END=1405 /DNA_ORIENTATION=-
MGEPADFDKVVDRAVGAPLSKMVPLAREFMVKNAINMRKNLFDVREVAERAVHAAPTLHLGHSWLALVAHQEGNLEERDRHMAEAKRIVTEYPQENECVMSLYCDSVERLDFPAWPSETAVVKEGRVWTVRSPFINHNNIPLDDQASVVKLRDGSVAIVNPVPFDEATKAWIERIGPVSKIVSPCKGHDECLKTVKDVFPRAKRYHVQPPTSPDDPLEITDDHQEFPDDLYHFRIQGQIFKETVFYDSSTKALLGITDSCIPTSDNRGDSFFIYQLGMGLLRGPFTSRFQVQNYNWMFITNYQEYRASLQKLLALDFDVVTHGHGGTVHGPEAKEGLKKAFNFALNETNDPSRFESVMLSTKWILDTFRPGIILQNAFSRMLPFGN